ncbi:Scr1 family TA system antitoxin-like transcriptional regulator [Actinocorallia populi]|uniref:Scr1 family TA system antitoxin-like transcriptional regulator n=1 Tax=Actinocorallia populi TaxID=2079200 RepID=UPI000D08E58F|nr:Scr1 family TA system antitoxin-like transcriptional regulator [Actinocorallia populi]
MSHGSTEEVVAAFIAELKAAWAMASPTYAAVERLAEELRKRPVQHGRRIVPLPAATVNDLLTKPRRRLPRWEMTASLLTVLREILADRGEDPDRVGTLAAWKARHEASLTAMDTIRSRRRGGRVGVASGDPDPEELARERLAIEDAQRATLLKTAGSGEPKWWHPYRDVVPAWATAYLSLEQSSHRLQIYEPGAVPDLLWTAERARRAALCEHPGAPEDVIDRKVALQLSRRRMLRRSEPARLWVLLDEAAVAPFGDRALWRAQTEHLLDLASLPHVSLQLRRAGPDRGLIGDAVRLLRFHEKEFPDVICLRQDRTALYPPESQVVHHYTALLKGQFFAAETPETSVQILSDLLKRHQ